MKNFSVRTDLALEACQTSDFYSSDLSGVKVSTQDFKNNISVTSVNIINENGERKLLKPKGIYITIECQDLRKNNTECREAVTKILVSNIKKLLSDISSTTEKKYKNILVVGLGNRKITPDALGSKTISKILVTRHLKNFVPDELKNKNCVSAISPGVLGVTGLETLEVIKSLCDTIKPDLIFIIDSLAARSSSRINSTIQLSNTGIAPGAGIGNKQPALDKKSLGCDIISIGVPTVIDAATLVNDTVDKILDIISSSHEKKFMHDLFDILNKFDSERKYELIKNILEPYHENMFVTPKEVDEVIERLSDIIADAINISLHDEVTINNLNKFR